MRKSSAPGARTSAVEVLGMTPHALWLMVNAQEYMLDFATFPWFAKATMDEVCNVSLSHGIHLHWPKLDVDLHLDSLKNPQNYPLVSSKKRSAKKR